MDLLHMCSLNMALLQDVTFLLCTLLLCNILSHIFL